MQSATHYLMADRHKKPKKEKLDYIPARNEKNAGERVPITSYVLAEELPVIEAARRLMRQGRSAYIRDCVLDRSYEILRQENRMRSTQGLPPIEDPPKRR